MAKRITIVIDESLIKKLYEMQAKIIKETSSSMSFSKVVNNAIRKGLK